MDFGDIPLCEQATVVVTLSNAGALSASWVVTDRTAPDMLPPAALEAGEAGGDEAARKEDEVLRDVYVDGDRRVLRFAAAGRVGGYASAAIPVTLRPGRVGAWSGSVLLEFPAKSGVAPIALTARANVTEAPIFLTRPLVDFKTLLYVHCPISTSIALVDSSVPVLPHAIHFIIKAEAP